MMYYLLLLSWWFSFTTPVSPKPTPKAYAARNGRVMRVTKRLSHILSENTQLEKNSSVTTTPVQLKLLPLRQGDSAICVRYLPLANPQIEIMEEVVAWCERFGGRTDDALACLLGHELAHHYHNHGRYKVQFLFLSVEGSKPEDVINLEAIADQSGIFAAYFAGYDAFTMAPRIYEDIYRVFRHNKPPSNYLPLTQRLRMVRDTSLRVRELSHWCELAEFFYLKQDYLAANLALTEVLKRYPAPVVRNNLGAIKLNHAISLMGRVTNNSRLRYAFPIEYDAQNRLLDSRRRASPTEYQQLLNDAERLFEGLVQYQPDYEAARINLAIVHLLKGEAPLAKRVLLPLLNRSGAPSANGVLMMAITETELNNRTGAQSLFAQAKRLGAYKAAYNEVMSKPSWQQLIDKTLLKFFGPHQPTPKARRSWPIYPANWQNSPVKAELGKLGGSLVKYAFTEGSAIYEAQGYQQQDRPKYRIARSTVQDLPGLRIGSTRQQLTRSFDQPSREIAGARGTQFLEYVNAASGLWLEYRDDFLVGWTAYEKK